MVFDDTGRVTRAFCVRAGVDALKALAGLVGGAATILEADGSRASCGAHAHGLVLQYPTGLTLWAERRVAGILAECVDARMRYRALGVGRTGDGLRHGAAELSGDVDGQLVLARTDGLVGRDDALLVVGASVSGARVAADSRVAILSD